MGYKKSCGGEGEKREVEALKRIPAIGWGRVGGD